MSLGEKICNLRKSKGFTQEQLSEMSLISLRTIQRIEKDVTVPRLHTLGILASVLGVPTEELTVSSRPSDIGDPEETLSILNRINFLSFAMLIVPVAGILCPYLLWKRYQERDHVREVGKRIISFQILWAVSSLLLMIIYQITQVALTQSVQIGHFPALLLVYVFVLLINFMMIVRTAFQLQRKDLAVYNFVPALF